MPKMAPGVKVGGGGGDSGDPIGDALVRTHPQGVGGHCGGWVSPPWGMLRSHCSPPTGAPLPEGLSRLLGVLGDLEQCHRLAQPPAPPAPALLQLQT